MAANPAGQSSPTLDRNAIQEAIRKKYAGVSRQAAGFFSYPVGRAGAELLGYDLDVLAGMPDQQLQSFCGVGNPFKIYPLPVGAVVLDLGCGCGFDCYVASRYVGPSGRVIGVDMTEEMTVAARANMAALEADNVEIIHNDGQTLPVDDNSVDVVISNGVINLAPDKRHLFMEIFRILKPGGRLQFADIILTRELPAHLAVGVESWSQ